MLLDFSDYKRTGISRVISHCADPNVYGNVTKAVLQVIPSRGDRQSVHDVVRSLLEIREETAPFNHSHFCVGIAYVDEC